MKFYILAAIGFTIVCGCGRKPSGPTTVGGRTVADWTRDARSNDPRVRALAVSKLGNVGSSDPEALQVVRTALGDPDPRVRRASILAIPKFGPEATASLAKTLESIARTDRDPSIRKLAARARNNN